MTEDNRPLECIDKIPFDSQKEAATAASVAQYQHGSKLKSYKCRICKLWHLASRYEY
jgi:hypothetical protein